VKNEEEKRGVVPPDVTWEEITPGGTISHPGNSREFKTGDWRSMKPVYLEEKCTQCMLCPPICPDSAIPVNDEGKRLDFNYDYCKGCGVCAKVCPFGAIDFVEESE